MYVCVHLCVKSRVRVRFAIIDTWVFLKVEYTVYPNKVKFNWDNED